MEEMPNLNEWWFCQAWTRGEYQVVAFGRDGQRHPQFIVVGFHDSIPGLPIVWLGPRYTQKGAMKFVRKMMDVMDKLIAEKVE